MTKGFGPIPEGFHTVTPYLMVPDADALVGFMGRAFGAEETFRARGAHGGSHVEVRLGDSMVMIGGMQHSEPRPAATFLYMDGVDDVYRRALEAGATPIEEPADRPADGDRRAGFTDPFGNAWFVAARIEDVSREELRKRHEDLLKRTLDYISDNLSSPGGLPLAELASQANVSPYHFSRLFRRSTGLTPHQYVIRERIERAKELLLRGEMPVAAVAKEVGFSDQGHLSRHTRRLLGATPGEIQREGRAKNGRAEESKILRA